jgi:hypothetical protein
MQNTDLMQKMHIGRFSELPKTILIAMLGVALVATIGVDVTGSPTHRSATTAATHHVAKTHRHVASTPVTTVPSTTTTGAPVVVPLAPVAATTPPPVKLASDVVAAKKPVPAKPVPAKPVPAKPVPAPVVRSTSALGLFVGSQAPADVLALGQQLGVTPTIETVYADQSSGYCTYSPPTTSMTLMVGIGNCLGAQVAVIGQNLVHAGQSHAVIRVMWEQNQDLSGWFQNWNQLTLSSAQYTSTFQNIVTTMRAVPNQAFRFMWNPNGGTGNEAPGRTWTDTWPGKSSVDLVGVDQYDYPGYAANIQAVVAFAHSQGLPTAIAEWGLNGSDDPSFINGVASLVNNPANDFAVQAYFSYAGSTDSDIAQFPASEAAYKADLG